MNWKSHFVAVWFQAPNMFVEEMQKIYTGVLLWNFWKRYVAIIFDDSDWIQRSVIRDIRHDLFLWAKSMSGWKIAASDPMLF